MCPAQRADPADWIRLAQSGQPEAFENLVHEHQATVWRLGVRLLGNASEAQDLVQETFLSVYRHLSRFDASRPFRPWLVTIATRLGLNMLRARKRGRLEPVEELEAPDPTPGPAEQAERQAEVDRLMAAVSRLDAVPRTIVVLHYTEGMTCAQIGSALEMTESAVKVALFRARERLRQVLKGARW